jgi:hypothetical protein
MVSIFSRERILPMASSGEFFGTVFKFMAYCTRYQNKTFASSAGLVKMIGNDQYIGVDYTNTEVVTNNGDGRASVRIETKKTYTRGLFVVDLKHMPGGICGTW